VVGLRKKVVGLRKKVVGLRKKVVGLRLQPDVEIATGMRGAEFIPLQH